MLGDLYRKRHNKDNIIISSKVKKIHNLIKDYTSEKKLNELKILEVGCNSGIFLSELRLCFEQLSPDLNVSYFGIDIDSDAIENNVDKKNTLQNISAEEYSEATKEKFDFVLHFELIEHLANPFKFALSINSLLIPGGIHFFTTPNGDGFDNIAINYNKIRLLAHSIFPPMHLNSFSPSSISILSLRSSFDILSIDTPGIFDVDMVKLSYEDLDDKSPFKFINSLNNEQLGYLQACLQKLKASSHMEITLSKVV
jgi:SAM-dependent methyltransferase